MKKCIALLRGVNVGGKNKIAMPNLQAAFEAAGFSDVLTYINSGNIIFSAAGEEAELSARCEAIIKTRFGLNISVAVISAEALAEALHGAPSWWGDDSKSKHNAIFVIPPADAAEIAKQAGEIKPEYEKIATCGQVIFWSAPIATFSKTRWSKVSATSAYQSITIRNANTAKKLAALTK